MAWLTRGITLKELIGHQCSCDFDLPTSEWPIHGYPAWVVIEAVDMPMIKMRSKFGGTSLWVNASTIKKIEAVD